MDNLELYGYQGYQGLKFHMEEAYLEKARESVWDPPYAIFSKKYYNELNNLNHDKIHDFCFIGSIKSDMSRIWVIDFAKKYFTSNSIFVNTDNDSTWQSLGNYDFTNKVSCHCPKNASGDTQRKDNVYRIISENIFYFQTMCNSKFILCPKGDSPWSFRFYETILCKSIPIVESFHHTYRTIQESKIKYRYFLNTDIDNIINITSETYLTLINDNIKNLEEYHLLK